LTSTTVPTPTTIDLRSLIATHARSAGVRHITISPFCTRHDNDRFFSHRAGDAGRQVAVLAREEVREKAESRKQKADTAHRSTSRAQSQSLRPRSTCTLPPEPCSSRPAS